MFFALLPLFSPDKRKTFDCVTHKKRNERERETEGQCLYEIENKN